jgi:hypothetical protein
MITASSDSAHRGKDVREVISEVQRVLEQIGNPAYCPLVAALSPNNGMDVWPSFNPYVHINVVIPVAG